MSEDGLELDTIIALEGRITAALDRIAGAAAANAVAAHSGEDSAGRAEAQARAETLASELSEARAQIEDLQGSLSEAKAAEETLRQELEAAQSAANEAPEPAEDSEELSVLQEKSDRLRRERDAARAERDALAEELDAFRAAARGEPAGVLRALRALRSANASLRDSSDGLRKAAMTGSGAPSGETLNAAMAAELLSMRAERAADAAEMQLIVDELRPMTEGAAHA